MKINMNIYQKKINKQAKLFRIFHSNLWRLNNYPFCKARIDIRLMNKEDSVNSIQLINKEIKEIKEALVDFEGVVCIKT